MPVRILGDEGVAEIHRHRRLRDPATGLAPTPVPGVDVRVALQCEREFARTGFGHRDRLHPVHPRISGYVRHLPWTVPKITLQRAIPRARERVGLLGVRIHDLRHSAASEMINAGVDLYIYTVGAGLGHKDSRSTQRYAHLATATLADAVRKIGKSSPTTKKKPPDLAALMLL